MEQLWPWPQDPEGGGLPAAALFPPKSVPSYFKRPTAAFVDGRAAGIERCVRGLVERAASEAGSGLGEWVAHWLRHAERPPAPPAPPSHGEQAGALTAVDAE